MIHERARAKERTLAPLLRIIWGARPSLVLALVGLHVADSVAVTAIVYVGKHLVDAVVATREGRPAEPLTWVILECVLVGVHALNAQVSAYVQLALSGRLGLHVNTLLLRKVANVSFARLEDPAFSDSLESARGASMRAIAFVTQSLAFVRSLVFLVGASVLLWAVGAWTLPILLLSSAPRVLVERSFGRKAFEQKKARAARTRKVSYLESVMLAEPHVKEVKLLSIATTLLERYRDIYQSFYLEEERVARVQRSVRSALGLLTTGLLYASYGYFVLRAARSEISLGTMTLSLIALRQVQTALDTAVAAMTGAYEESLALDHVLDVLDLPDDEPIRVLETRPDGSPPSIELENVFFRYPGAARDTLRGVNATFKAGESIAIVGENGAGKTTLVKLLTRLHDVTSGRILIDGVDIATMDATELRSRIGVVFQDFAKFHLTLRENVGFGWVPAVDEDDALIQALDDAGASSFVSKLRDGLDTPLGKVFGGEDLSGGQWQRIALARAFMRDSRILILDEPTASVDVETEHEILERIHALKANRTALLITHRFSNVRLADRILVLENGRIVEEGSHDHLMSSCGAYAAMFERQAGGYR